MPARVTVPSTIRMLRRTIHCGPNFSCNFGLMKHASGGADCQDAEVGAALGDLSRHGNGLIELDDSDCDQSDQRHKNVREDRIHF